MASVPAPRCNTQNKSDAMYVITDAGATVTANFNLTTIAGKPKWAPQKTTLWVDGATPADADIVLVDENNITHIITVPAGIVLVLARPFKQITETGTEDVNVIFEWFDPGGSLDWNKLASEV